MYCRYQSPWPRLHSAGLEDPQLLLQRTLRSTHERFDPGPRRCLNLGSRVTDLFRSECSGPGHVTAEERVTVASKHGLAVAIQTRTYRTDVEVASTCQARNVTCGS